MTNRYSRQSLEHGPDLQAVAQRAELASAEPAVGKAVAMIYAMVAHKLSMFYDEGYWLTQAQAAALCADWLTRTGASMPLSERKRLADLSDGVARQIRDTLSREAGLFTAHELMESLDPRYVSEVGGSIMEECVRVLRSAE